MKKSPSKKPYFWICFVIILIGVVYALSPTLQESVREYTKPLNKDSINTVKSTLDVVDNPKKYLGREILLKDSLLCFSNGIVAYREDGSRNTLKFSYQRDINEWYVFDLYGKVAQSKGGYYFNVSRAVQKQNVKEVNWAHAMKNICD